MSRPRKVDRPKNKRLSIRTSIIERVNFSLADPLTGDPPYGAWTKLVEELLKKWLAGEVTTRQSPKAVNLDNMMDK